MTSIQIPILARVEGEGALELQIRDHQITQLQLRIYEPPRLFEKFLIGREPNEVIDAVARICGICPIAYQMSAVHAIEQIFKIEITPWVYDLRRLFYCGEWIVSHSLHIHMLSAPDFLGYSSVFDMAKDYPDMVKRGMKLHALGGELVSLLGKRTVHPVGVCVGGFYFSPTESEIKRVLALLEENVLHAKELLEWSCTLPIPKYQQSFTSVSLRHPEEYPMNAGDIVSSDGLHISISEFENHFQESQVPYSTALHAHLNGKSYLVGPLARMNLNWQLLPDPIQQILNQYHITFPSDNMCHSMLARCVEIYYAMLESIRILKNYVVAKNSHEKIMPCAGVGFGATEAPRGLLWHRYELDEKGLVKFSRIVPPTSQNQARIEEDLRYSLTQYGLDHSEQELRARSEMIIRNYDPCISCSTHFLKLKVDR